MVDGLKETYDLQQQFKLKYTREALRVIEAAAEIERAETDVI